MKIFYTHSEFFNAIRNNDVEAVKKYLQKSKKWLRVRDQDGTPPAYFAVHHNKPDILQLFIKHDSSSVLEKDKFGDTSLHGAVYQNNIDLLRVCSDADRQCAYIRNKNGETAMHLATKWAEEKQALLDELVVREQDCLILTDNNGDTPLHLAVRNQDLKNAKTFIEAKRECVSIKNQNCETPLHIAAAEGCLPIVEALLKKEPSLAHYKDDNDKKPIDLAIEHVCVEIVEKLINIAPDSYDTSVLERVIEKGHAAMIDKVFANPVCAAYIERNPSQKLLHFALEHDLDGLLQILIDSGKANMKDGMPAGYRAAMTGSTKCLQVLIANGADILPSHSHQISKKTYDSRTRYYNIVIPPLFAAILNGHTAAALELLNAGANPNEAFTSEYGHAVEYPLQLAISLNNPEVVFALLQKGAKKNLQDTKRGSAIDCAKQFALRDMITMLETDVPYRAAVKKPVVPVPAPAVEPEPTDKWVLLNQKELANIRFYPAINRKLTEIFNFANYERLIITENLAEKRECMSQPIPFADVDEETLSAAWTEFKKKGCSADETRVFKNCIRIVRKG